MRVKYLLQFAGRLVTSNREQAENLLSTSCHSTHCGIPIGFVEALTVDPSTISLLMPVCCLSASNTPCSDVVRYLFLCPPAPLAPTIGDRSDGIISQRGLRVQLPRVRNPKFIPMETQIVGHINKPRVRQDEHSYLASCLCSRSDQLVDLIRYIGRRLSKGGGERENCDVFQFLRLRITQYITFSRLVCRACSQCRKTEPCNSYLYGSECLNWNSKTTTRLETPISILIRDNIALCIKVFKSR